jgi:hypothetical protein
MSDVWLLGRQQRLLYYFIFLSFANSVFHLPSDDEIGFDDVNWSTMSDVVVKVLLLLFVRVHDAGISIIAQREQEKTHTKRKLFYVSIGDTLLCIRDAWSSALRPVEFWQRLTARMSGTENTSHLCGMTGKCSAKRKGMLQHFDFIFSTV